MNAGGVLERALPRYLMGGELQGAARDWVEAADIAKRFKADHFQQS